MDSCLGGDDLRVRNPVFSNTKVSPTGYFFHTLTNLSIMVSAF